MAFSRTSKTKGKRDYNRRKKAPKARISRVKISQTLPDSVKVKLSDVYTDNVSTTTSDTFFEFAMNGCYDPYLGIGGGQPQGFDQWMAMYKNFRVHSSAISVYYNNELTSGVTQVSIVPNFGSDNTLRTYFNPSQLQYCKYRRFTSEAGGKGSGTVSHYMSVGKISGNKTAYKNSEDFWGNSVSNPNGDGLCVWYVLVQDPINAGLSLNGQILVKLTYYVEFFGRKALQDS